MTVDAPPFKFGLERVRSLRAQAEDRAREELAGELAQRLRNASLLEQASERAAAARDAARASARRSASGIDLLAAQTYIERARRSQLDAALELDRRDAEVAARRQALLHATQARQTIDKLAERRRRDHDLEWARRAQGDLDEIALAVHRRRSVSV